MINWDVTKLIRGKRQGITHVQVVCEVCGKARWVQTGNAKMLPDGHYCRSCSNLKAWDGNRIDLENGKVCCDCGKRKPLSEFSSDRRKRGNKRSYCLECAAKRSREYRKEHKEKYRSNKRMSQMRRRAAINNCGGNFTNADWEDVLDKYGRRCLKCGATEDLQPDHVIPISKGGANDKSNIQPLCGFCNRSKSATAIDYR